MPSFHIEVTDETFARVVERMKGESGKGRTTAEIHEAIVVAGLDALEGKGATAPKAPKKK